jgi:hypothetical protein
MAKKKIKKPVSKRVKKTDIPKVRKPRVKKPKSVVTTEPAIKTVWSEGSVNDFLADVGAVPTPVPTHADTPLVPPVEYTKISVPSRLNYLDDLEKSNSWTSAIKELHGDISKWCDEVSDNPIEKIKEFAFNHPLTFAITFCTAFTVVVVAAAAAMRYFR